MELIGKPLHSFSSGVITVSRRHASRHAYSCSGNTCLRLLRMSRPPSALFTERSSTLNSPRLNTAPVIFVLESWSEQQMSSQHSSTRLCLLIHHYDDQHKGWIVIHPLWALFVYECTKRVLPMLISALTSFEYSIALIGKDDRGECGSATEPTAARAHRTRTK